jgi:response regulator RpfG family c-di-GMP phosphodiesterase
LRRNVLNTDKKRILIIDDEMSPRESIKLVLKDRYMVSAVSGAVEGIGHMAQNPVDLVVLDIKMPGMDGITALQEIKKRHPETEVVLLTAYGTLETARSAIRLGAFDYLQKPFDKDDVIKVVERGLEKKFAGEHLKLERDQLLNKAKFLEDQVSKARQNIMMSYEGTVKALIMTIDAKDHYTFDHSEHVARLSTLIADALGLTKNVKDKIENAASIHDIGKIGIDENILRKRGPLTADEFSEIKKHPEIGATIVQAVPFLEDAIPVILYHHERYDGRGYPEGLKGEEIPLNARIVGVADAVDAMLNARPYRDSLPMDKILGELRNNSGTQFDPLIADLILKGKISLR